MKRNHFGSLPLAAHTKFNIADVIVTIPKTIHILITSAYPDLVDIRHSGTCFSSAYGLPGNMHFLGKLYLSHPHALSFFSDFGP